MELKGGELQPAGEAPYPHVELGENPYNGIERVIVLFDDPVRVLLRRIHTMELKVTIPLPPEVRKEKENPYNGIESKQPQPHEVNLRLDNRNPYNGIERPRGKTGSGDAR